jgi:uncharacterized tellurite resistance protein B-like protein
MRCYCIDQRVRFLKAYADIVNVDCEREAVEAIMSSRVLQLLYFLSATAMSQSQL